MTPTELHAAVAPLWARDAGFRPRYIDPVGERLIHDRITGVGEDDEQEVVAALIRDRIMERLGERENSVSVFKGTDGVWYVTLEGSDVVDDGGFAEPSIVERSQDLTLALIAAAMKATEPVPNRTVVDYLPDYADGVGPTASSPPGP